MCSNFFVVSGIVPPLITFWQYGYLSQTPRPVKGSETHNPKSWLSLNIKPKLLWLQGIAMTAGDVLELVAAAPKGSLAPVVTPTVSYGIFRTLYFKVTRRRFFTYGFWRFHKLTLTVKSLHLSSAQKSDCVSTLDSMQRLSHGPQLWERDLLLASVWSALVILTLEEVVL